MACAANGSPQTGLGNTDPACGFPLVQTPQAARFDYALTNSFGFGGANASLVLRRFA
jgi:3-oxoacyl-[acyl-carrier-protein] synthase II